MTWRRVQLRALAWLLKGEEGFGALTLPVVEQLDISGQAGAAIPLLSALCLR